MVSSVEVSKRRLISTSFDPRGCTYKLSGRIRNHVEEITKNKDIDKDVKSIIIQIMNEEEKNKNTLDYESLVKLHKYIQRADRDYLDPFHLFSADCKCIEPKPRENQQLQRRLELLRLEQSQTFYNKMTASVDRLVENKLEQLEDSDQRPSLGLQKDRSAVTQEFKKMNGSIVAVFNSFLVYICTFIFCYKALEYALAEPNIIAQVLFGLAGSTVVACAEIYFLLRVV